MSEERSADPAPADPERRSKVGRIIAERDLVGMGERLERYWLGETDERYSLRDLADYFNRHVLRSAMEDAGIQVLDGEDDHLYGLLTDDDVTGGTRTQAERRLEREGIDVGALTDDFVSHQAVHTYLTKYRGVERDEEESADKLQQGRNTIQQLRNRLRAVTETTVSALANADQITLGEADVYVDIRVSCSECGTQYPVGDLLDRGGCDCD